MTQTPVQRPSGPELPEVPGPREVASTVKHITDNAPRAFLWDYDRSRSQLMTLYSKGVSSQWSSERDLDWSTDVDPERLVTDTKQPYAMVELVRTAAEIDRSPFASWGEKEFTEFGIENLKAQLSQFMHGEQGAMLAAAKIVETVPWIDAKYYAATQTMDEARHTEVYSRYLHDKLGDHYPMSPPLEAQITALVEDSRWDITYLGMQVVIESLALAAFGNLQDTIEEPLLNKLLRYVLSDEARHVAFGVVTLKEYYRDLSDAELKDRQEFLADNTIRNRSRSGMPEVWERVGLKFEDVLPFLMEAAMKRREMGASVYGSFNRGFFSKLVPNVRKIGLLDANNGYLRKLWAEAGLLKYEFADDTSEDYLTYDVVASDRAGSDRASRSTD